MSGPLVVTSDWHADAYTMGVARYAEVEQAALHTLEVAIADRAAAYVFAGDLCDPDSGSSVFRCVELALHVATQLSDAGIPSFWVAGNHDVVEDGSGDTTLSPLRAIAGKLVHVVEAPASHVAPGWPLAFFPFAATSRSYDPAGEARKAGGCAGYVVVGHLNVAGIIPGEETTDMPRGREVMFPASETTRARLRINGHYHRQQAFDPGDGGPAILVPGSPARFTFGEEGNSPGFLVLGG